VPTTTNYALRYPALSDAPNVPQSMGNLAADVDTLLAGFGVWTSFTPILYTQTSGTRASIGKTVTYAKYIKLGKTVLATADVTATATSTGGVSLSLPFAAPVRQLVVGSAAVMGGTPPTQSGLAYMAGTPFDAIICVTNTAAQNDIVTGQTFRYSVQYEAA
jgi:hypothetical protein